MSMDDDGGLQAHLFIQHALQLSIHHADAEIEGLIRITSRTGSPQSASAFMPPGGMKPDLRPGLTDAAELRRLELPILEVRLCDDDMCVSSAASVSPDLTAQAAAAGKCCRQGACPAHQRIITPPHPHCMAAGGAYVRAAALS